MTPEHILTEVSHSY